MSLDAALAIAAAELPSERRDRPLDGFIRDTRTRNTLIRAGIENVATLLEHRALSLRAINRVGPASCQKIAADLRAAIAKTGAPAEDLKTYLSWKQARLRELEQRLAHESYRRRDLERGRP